MPAGEGRHTQGCLRKTGQWSPLASSLTGGCRCCSCPADPRGKAAAQASVDHAVPRPPPPLVRVTLPPPHPPQAFPPPAVSAQFSLVRVPWLDTEALAVCRPARPPPPTGAGHSLGSHTCGQFSFYEFTERCVHVAGGGHVVNMENLEHSTATESSRISAVEGEEAVLLAAHEGMAFAAGMGADSTEQLSVGGGLPEEGASPSCPQRAPQPSRSPSAPPKRCFLTVLGSRNTHLFTDRQRHRTVLSSLGTPQDLATSKR